MSPSHIWRYHFFMMSPSPAIKSPHSTWQIAAVATSPWEKIGDMATAPPRDSNRPKVMSFLVYHDRPISWAGKAPPFLPSVHGEGKVEVLKCVTFEGKNKGNKSSFPEWKRKNFLRFDYSVN